MVPWFRSSVHCPVACLHDSILIHTADKLENSFAAVVFKNVTTAPTKVLYKSRSGLTSHGSGNLPNSQLKTQLCLAS